MDKNALRSSIKAYCLEIQEMSVSGGAGAFLTPKAFKKQKQVLHKSIKEIQLKLDEVNKLIYFTSRIKGKLIEGKQEIEYLKRTKNNINKIQNRLKESFNKLCILDEIKVIIPARIWDFTKPISNFDPDNIKVGDRIKTKKEEFVVNKISIGHNDFQTKFFGGEDYISKSSLIFMNKIRHNQ